MNRFRPGVEALDSRTLPSAVFATADSSLLSAAQVVQVADDSASTDAAATTASGTLQIELENVLVSSYQATVAASAAPAESEGGQPADGSLDPAAEKVTFQDFHFTAKVSKSSPG
jgi:hypothetical protein